jgi:hypothetical protein
MKTVGISVDRFIAILVETTPLAVFLGIRAERIEDGEAWSRINSAQPHCGRVVLIAVQR